jgi:hypothetical protein
VGTDALWNDLFFTAAGTLTKDELHEHIKKSIARLHEIVRTMDVRMAEAAGEPMPDDPFEHVPISDEGLLQWAQYEPGRPFMLDEDTNITWHVHPAPLATAA